MKHYSSDLDDTPGNELIQLCELVAEILTGDLGHEVSPEATMCQIFIKRNLRDAFTNMEVLLRIYLTLIIINCSEICLFPSCN